MAGIAPARGDDRPCVRPDCVGTMRFGRASHNGEGRESQGTVKILSSVANPNPHGWICSADASHFRLNGSKS